MQAHACPCIGNKPLLAVLLYKVLYSVLGAEPGAEAEKEMGLLHADLQDVDVILALDLPLNKAWYKPLYPQLSIVIWSHQIQTELAWSWEPTASGSYTHVAMSRNKTTITP